MILPVSVLALIFFFSYLSSVRNQSFFFLIGGKQEKDLVIGQHYIHKDFYKCSRTAKCTHVVKYVTSSNYEMVYNKDAIQNITEEIIVWERLCEYFTYTIPTSLVSTVDRRRRGRDRIAVALVEANPLSSFLKVTL